MSQQGASNQFKSMGYDHPSYTSRQAAILGAIAAGSGGVTSKFVAHAAMLLFAIHAFVTTAATATATQTVNGTATVHINSQALNVIRITNTAGTGVAPALATSTVGPFYADTLYANGTYTGSVGSYLTAPINTNTGSAGFGGLQINEGDQVYVVSGTDTAAVALISIDYQILPLANVTA